MPAAGPRRQQGRGGSRRVAAMRASRRGGLDGVGLPLGKLLPAASHARGQEPVGVAVDCRHATRP
eukprot:scaffold19107_cov63-Phaeocystis_antarctica.AAC.1